VTQRDHEAPAPARQTGDDHSGVNVDSLAFLMTVRGTSLLRSPSKVPRENRARAVADSELDAHLDAGHALQRFALHHLTL
jgi:hypothetical protein